MSGKRKGPKGRSKGRGPGPSSKKPPVPRTGGPKGRRGTEDAPGPNRATRRAALQRPAGGGPGERPSLTGQSRSL